VVDLGEGVALPYFYHPHNCGMPGDRRRTERTVELAVANAWLEGSHDAWEIGAVSPSYWPGRVPHVVDPADSHPAVTHHCSLFTLDLRGCDVLSISTVEHVGEARYGLAEAATPAEALEKILAEARSSLVTFPLGCNAALDDLVIGGAFEARCAVRLLVRNADDSWSPAAGEAARRPYGTGWDPALGHAPWANAIAILERGGRVLRSGAARRP
jgi:hypothetical protein